MAEEISNRTALKSQYSIKEIVEFMAEYFNVGREEILNNEKSELKHIAIWLIKNNTGAANREIGNFFGGITYSAAAKIYERFRIKLQKSRKLRRQLAEVERALSKVKVRSLP